MYMSICIVFYDKIPSKYTLISYDKINENKSLQYIYIMLTVLLYIILIVYGFYTLSS